MRLAVFTNQFPGPTTSFFARDMRALLEAGVALDIFPFYPCDPSLWRFVPDLLTERELPRNRVHHIGLSDTFSRPRRGTLRRAPAFLDDTFRIGRAGLRYGVGSAARNAYVALKAWTWAQQNPPGRYDHVLAYWGNYAATAAYLFHRLTDPSVPFSMIVHARMDLYRQRTYLAEKMLYADNIFLVCEFNRSYIRETYPSVFPRIAGKIRLHQIGLNLEQLHFDPDGRVPCTVLAVGRLEPLKGLDVLLRAAHRLRQSGVNVEVDVVGGDEGDGEEARLKRLAVDLGIGEHVRFRGWVPPAEVETAMRRATVLVHSPVELDAMPTVLKEAMAVGTPVIAADVAGSPEILDHGRAGLLVPSGDVAALAQAIERVLADDSLRRRNADIARRHVEQHYDLWANGRRLAECLRATPRRAMVS